MNEEKKPASFNSFIESKPSENISNSNTVCELYESKRNGAPIPWDYWLVRQEITPSQAAKLVYCLDPIKWPNDNLGQGLNGEDLRIRIARTTEYLAEKNQRWTLSSIAQTLGADAVPFTMKQALENAPQAAPAANGEVRLSVTAQQNNAILKWLKLNEYESLKLPVPPSGKAGVKKFCRDALCANNKQLFLSTSVFNTAWERLRANSEIKDVQ